MAEEENKYKIIIVDDDDFLVNMYALKFSHSGVAVDACKLGAQLLEKLKGGAKVDLILLDVVMPDIDGMDLLRAIRQEKLADNIPIVMLTNQNDEKDISEAKQLGVAGYIVKSAATPSEVVEEALRIIKNPH